MNYARVFSRNFLITTLIVVVTAVIVEITLAQIAIFSKLIGYPDLFNLFLYTIFLIIYGVGQFVILQWIRLKIVTDSPTKPRMVAVLKGVSLLQWVLIFLLTMTIIQIVTKNYYSIFLTVGIVGISYGLASIMMLYLAWKFLRWYVYNKNMFVLAYLIATLVAGFNIVITAYLTIQILTDQPEKVRYSTLQQNVLLPEPTTTIYYFSKICTFATMWAAAGLLLKNFTTLSKFKYWTLMTIPLIYYLAQFQPQFTSFLFNYFRFDAEWFVTLYTLVFTAIEPIGGFLFALAFWITARKMESKNIKGYLFISGAGLLLFFASNHALILANYPYPPFGLVQICYIGLSAFLIFAGIQSSAMAVAHDDKLRYAIRKSVEQQKANLIGYIGESEMSDMIYRRTFELTKKLSTSIEETSSIGPTLTMDQVKDYIEEVMREKGISEKD